MLKIKVMVFCKLCPTTDLLREIDPELAKIIFKDTSVNVKPGQKLCASCRKRIPDLPSLHEDDIPLAQLLKPEHDDEEFQPEPAELRKERLDKLNTSFVAMDISPIKPQHSVNEAKKKRLAKRKITQVSEAVSSELADVIDVPPEILQPKCSRCDDLDKLMDDVYEKLKGCTRQEKMRLLTLVPERWSVQDVMKRFGDIEGITKHLVQSANDLKRAHGILADPPSKRGRPLADEIVDAVRKFYEDDEFSRNCPGRKDKVSIKLPDGSKVEKQKRLLLANLKELHLEFKKRNPSMEIGLSSFCALRPKWCLTVDSKGMHSVCVCTTHQNLKLMTDALPCKVDYKEVLSQLVCKLENRDCMIHRCPDCPGEDNLNIYLKNIFETATLDDHDVIHYKQWTSSGQSKLLDLQDTVTDFIEVFVSLADKATTHQFIVKAQSGYLRHLKETIPTHTEVIVLMDFAENYLFVCQDAIQGFHWETAQTTLHPFTVYFRDDTGDLQCQSFCVVSDDHSHSAVTVHKFLSDLIHCHLRVQFPQLKKIHYFSDGAASQYKNCKNFTNLCYHKDDFGIVGEWNFFATSHGKSPCDGIGGTVKRLVRRASLQAASSGHILTPEDFYNWCTTNIHNITFRYITTEQIQTHESKICERMANAKTLTGSRSHHKFVPINDHDLRMFRLSADDSSTLINATKTQDLNIPNSFTPVDPSKLNAGKFIAAVYDDAWYIGLIESVSTIHEDAMIKFMHRRPAPDSNTFFWPNRDDCCNVPYNHILCCVPAPEMNFTGRQILYTLDGQTVKHVEDIYNNFLVSNI